MIEGERSRTAGRVAVLRAAHQLADQPLIFPDPIALEIIGPETAERLRQDPHAYSGRASVYIRTFVAARSRVAEDTLAAAVRAGVGQYVVLGAGLDTFAYRNPYDGVRVFEVDHPATQAWKRQCLRRGGIELPSNLTFVPVDFERQRLTEELARAGHDAAAPTFFSWLGVTPYIADAAVTATLCDVASLAGEAGGIVFDYGVSPKDLRLIDRLILRLMSFRVKRLGEPWTTLFSPRTLAAALGAMGFRDVTDLGPAEIRERYLKNRTDGLRVGSLARIMIATGAGRRPA